MSKRQRKSTPRRITKDGKAASPEQQAPRQAGTIALNESGEWTVWMSDGAGGSRPASRAEADSIFASAQEPYITAARELVDRALHDPAFEPNVDGRYCEYVAWSKGLAPWFRPTFADLLTLTIEHFRQLYPKATSLRAGNRSGTALPDSATEIKSIIDTNYSEHHRGIKGAEIATRLSARGATVKDDAARVRQEFRRHLRPLGYSNDRQRGGYLPPSA